MTRHSEEYEEILLEEEEALGDDSAPPEDSPSDAKKREGLLPYEPAQVKAQRLMASVADPVSGKRLTKKRIAELCGVDHRTLWRWIRDPKRGGKREWYKAVESYIRDGLEADWALLVRVQRDEAISGKAKVGAFRNIARLLGRLGPEGIAEIPAETKTGVVIYLPDNGFGPERATEPLPPEIAARLGYPVQEAPATDSGDTGDSGDAGWERVGG